MLFFFFNDTATTEIYTLSLHDALPIFTATSPARLSRLVTSTAHEGWPGSRGRTCSTDEALSSRTSIRRPTVTVRNWAARSSTDRKSTRLNSSHSQISYAVFCLTKKKAH